MSDPAEGDARTLADLRQNIDVIDGELHRLLIDRAAVIDTLIRVKGTTVVANAFRPAREAAMMRRLAAAHTGALPLATVEHIWREIITTFTRLQARFSIATDISTDPEGMRDLARFYFGFSVDVDSMPDPAAAIDRVARHSDLGLVALAEGEADGAWWRALVGPSAPRVMAHLPFITGGDRSAGPKALVISPPLGDPTPPEIGIYAVRSQGVLPEARGVIVLASHRDGSWRDSLVAAESDPTTLPTGLGVAPDDIVEVGGIARGIALDGATSVLYAPISPSGDAQTP